jgi:hypothetical protein
LVAFKTTKGLNGFEPTTRSGWNTLLPSRLHSKFFPNSSYSYKNNLHFAARGKQLFNYNNSLKGVSFLKTLVTYTVNQKTQLLKSLVFSKKITYLSFKFYKKWNIQKRYVLNFLIKSSKVISRFSNKKKTFKLLLNRVYYYRQLKAIYNCDSFKTSQSSLFQTKYNSKRIRLYKALVESQAGTNLNNYRNLNFYYNSRNVFSKKLCLLITPSMSPLLCKLGYFFNYVTFF